jgi:hypothetical protein
LRQVGKQKLLLLLLLLPLLLLVAEQRPESDRRWTQRGSD